MQKSRKVSPKHRYCLGGNGLIKSFWVPFVPDGNRFLKKDLSFIDSGGYSVQRKAGEFLDCC